MWLPSRGLHRFHSSHHHSDSSTAQHLIIFTPATLLPPVSSSCSRSFSSSLGPLQPRASWRVKATPGGLSPFRIRPHDQRESITHPDFGAGIMAARWITVSPPSTARRLLPVLIDPFAFLMSCRERHRPIRTRCPSHGYAAAEHSRIAHAREDKHMRRWTDHRGYHCAQDERIFQGEVAESAPCAVVGCHAAASLCNNPVGGGICGSLDGPLPPASRRTQTCATPRSLLSHCL